MGTPERPSVMFDCTASGPLPRHRYPGLHQPNMPLTVIIYLAAEWKEVCFSLEFLSSSLRLAAQYVFTCHEVQWWSVCQCIWICVLSCYYFLIWTYFATVKKVCSIITSGFTTSVLLICNMSAALLHWQLQILSHGLTGYLKCHLNAHFRISLDVK